MTNKCCKSNYITTNSVSTNNDNQRTGALGLGAVDISNESEFVKALSWGGSKWNWSQGDSTKLSYYFGIEMSANDVNYPPGVESLNGSKINLKGWNSSEKIAMVKAMTKWTEIIGMEIEEVTNVANADLKLYLTEENVGYLGAQYGPHSYPYQGVGIYVRDSGDIWADSLEPGGFGFYIILHELGHGFGLAHPHDAGGDSINFPGVIYSNDLGDNNLNEHIFTVMSYNATNNSGINPSSYKGYGFAQGPGAFDIATMKVLYGLSSSYQNDNGIYTIKDTNSKGDGYTCIVDQGGNDIITYSGNNAVIIDLRPATIINELGGGGFVSKVDNQSIYNGFFIANGVIIENATGGSGDDNFYQVETVSNILRGNDGNDTVYYKDDYNQYTITQQIGYVEVTKGSATDQLYDIEKIHFQDSYLNTTDINNPIYPVINYNEYSSTTNKIINSSNNIITDSITISNNNQTISKISIVLNELLHTWVGDLKITLTKDPSSPSPKSVVLMNLSGPGEWGSNGNNFINTVLTDDASKDINDIEDNSESFTGEYYPSNDGTKTFLSDFNGLEMNGEWQLKIEDTYAPEDDGKLIKWSIRSELPNFEFGSVELSHNDKEIELSRKFSDPIICCADPTFRGTNTCIVRIKEIDNSGTKTKFKMYIQEAPNHDGIHVLETVTYFVGEKGEYDLGNNKKIEFGKLQTNKTGKSKKSSKFETINFNTDFLDDPIIISQVSSYNDNAYVLTRTNNINKSNFQVIMQKADGKNQSHSVETIHWVAISKGNFEYLGNKFECGTVSNVTHKTKNVDFKIDYFENKPNILTRVSSCKGTDPSNTRINYKNGFNIIIHEDTNKDTEMSHAKENINYIAINEILSTTNNFEFGSVELDHNDKEIELSRKFSDPIICCADPTFRETDTCIVRIKEIDNSGSKTKFKICIQEAPNHDGVHELETVTYFVGEKGEYNLGNNKKIEFGKLQTNKTGKNPSNFETVNFNTDFLDDPIIISQVSSYNDTAYVLTRTNNINKSSFQVKMQEADGKNQSHSEETIHWVAISKGNFEYQGNKFECGIVSNVSHKTKNVYFKSDYFENKPKILTRVSSCKGADPSNTRINYKNGFNIIIHEDTNKDTEINHAKENINYIAIE